MDFEELRTFVKTVRSGSFSQAARALSLSQPAVSRRIHKLERELGVKLLERDGGLFTPTRKGLEFLRFAEEVLAQYDALRRGMVEGELQGHLQIGASTTPGEFLLPGLLSRFLKRYPQVEAALHVMDSAAVEHCVTEGHCDVGFIGRRPRPGVLTSMPVCDDEIVLAAPVSHPFAGKAEVDLDELRGAVVVQRRHGSGTRATVEESLAERGLLMPPHKAIFEVTSVHSQLAAIRAGHGVGFVSRLAMTGAGDGIVTLRIAGHSMRRTIYMIYDERRDDPVYLSFIDYITSACTGHGSVLT